MEFNEALLNELVLLRQTLERIATSLEDIDDTLEIMFLEEDYEDEELGDLDALDFEGDDVVFGEEDQEVDAD